MSTGTHARLNLQVDPIACAGIGMCAHVAPELVTLDKWGYPMTNVDGAEHVDARRLAAAVAACPRRALFAG